MPDTKLFRNPTVVAVMLANSRPEMVARAVKSFRAQTYENKSLWIFDTSETFEMLRDVQDPPQPFPPAGNVQIGYEPSFAGKSIGALRNEAINRALWPDIICHWDSDDWSHPNRIAEQVALLQSSGAECVGYDEMLFWKEPKDAEMDVSTFDGPPKSQPVKLPGEAWLYRSTLPNYAIGTSMCYWRETWERTPFALYDDSKGCDDLYWFNGDPKRGVNPVKIVSASGIPAIPECMVPKPIGGGRVELTDPLRAFRENPELDLNPRMIASLHGGNTCAEIKPGVEWTRVPDWDSVCRKSMQL